MRSLNLDEKAIIFLDSFENLEYKVKTHILNLYANPSGIFEDYQPIESFFAKIDKIKTAKTVIMGLKDKEYVEEAVSRALTGADDAVTLYSNGYPTELKETSVPPLVLYARGNLDLLKDKKFGVVGSRKTLPLYCKKIEETVEKLTESGLTVVTGIAEGADSSAIKGGLKSGKVISVFAGEVAKVYPVSQNNLANQLLLSGGLIISEYPYGRTPKIYTYPVRNRIIAGLCLGSLIASGEENSGTRYTADYSLDYGREVFAFPYGLGVKSGEICKRLIKNGACMVESAEEIAEVLGITLKEEQKTEVVLEDNEKPIYKLIIDGVGSPDEIAEKSGLMIFEIISALGMMELKGLIVKDGNGNYSAIK